MQARRPFTSTLRDVGRRAGVSHTTVSRVLSGKPGISEGTRCAVLEAVREVGYLPNAAARSLVCRRDGRFPVAIQLLVCHLAPLDQSRAGTFQMQVLEGIHDAARADGDVDVHLSYWSSEAQPQEEVAKLLRKNGVLVMGNSDRSLAEALVAHHVPAVLVDHDHEGVPLDAVVSDNLAGGRMAARYLIDRGHRRIGWISGPLFYTAYRQRLDGVRLAIDDAGLRLLPRDCCIAPDNQMALFDRLLTDWVREGDLPSAVIAASSLAVPSFLHALREHGQRCPEHVSVLSCDRDIFAEVCRPILTTMATYPREIGRRAMLRLLERVRADDPPRPMKFVLPMDLTEGESVRSL